MRARLGFAVVSLSLLTTGALLAQVSPVPVRRAWRPLASNVIVPQSRAVAMDRAADTVEITAVRAGVIVVEQVATTTLEIDLRNPGAGRLEAELLVPVPAAAVVRGFAFQGTAAEPTAELLPREEAREIYDSIVARTRDPALLEFVGYRLIRSSVFPVEPGATQIVRLTYEVLLAAEGSRVDYVLPRTESVDYRVPWTITVKIRSKRPISTVYSPSHHIETRHDGAEEVSVRTSGASTHEPGPFRLSYLRKDGDVTASLLAYPDVESAGGYFLLLAGLPPGRDHERNALRREVTLVLDRSGSMNGDKLAQVREAARQVLAGLEDGELFNILVYNESVDAFSPGLVEKSAVSMKEARGFLDGIRARGGTNIHDALHEALRQKPGAGSLPIVLFLTDGLPTMGQTSEIAIRELASKHNPHRRRIFTFGVGTDVNTPLLESVAFESRGFTTIVLPGEDVEVEVARVFERLSGPVLADTRLETLDAEGHVARGRITDVVPPVLPDLYEGDQLVLLGRYHGEGPISFVVRGNYLGRTREFHFRFGFEKATTRHAFVPRLWAGRKIGMLEDAVRRLGADRFPQPGRPEDPRLGELVDEIVRLSTEFGILTEYTSFLAREGTDLSRKDSVIAEATENFRRRALSIRWGPAAVNQDLNRQQQKSQKCLNLRNSYLDAKLERVEITAVQQVADRAFYRRGTRWVDSRIVGAGGEQGEPRAIEFGSDDFLRLARRLAAEGRQGCISLRGDILLEVDGETLLVRAPRR